MATKYTDKKQARATAEHVDPEAQQEPSSPARQQSADSSDDGALSEAGEIAGSAIDSSGDAPPLPDEALPEDDGWMHEWDMAAQTWFFINKFTGKKQWENPRVPEANATGYGTYDRFAPRSEMVFLLTSQTDRSPSQLCKQHRSRHHGLCWRSGHLIPAPTPPWRIQPSYPW